MGSARNRTLIAGLAVGAMGTAAVPVVVLLLAFPAASSQTDSDRVRTVLDEMNRSYNHADFGAFAAHVCDRMLHSAGYEAGWYASRKSDGPTHITINSVDITGDDAVANVRFQADNRDAGRTLDLDFQRDGSEWKACRFRSARSV